MTDATTHRRASTKQRLWLALLGLALLPISPVLWALTLDNSLLRRTGLMMWAAMALALLCAAVAAGSDSRKRTRFVAGLVGLWVLLSIPGYLVFTRLPVPAESGTVANATDLVLADHLGRPTSLDELLQKTAILLVFYRGHW